ncbi:hypothetical protein N0V90_002822 [Kalmusia sp. IMI 367209]|nr:hypothetical protein N0V90_002822 [Kalmusia sp. IMI 367209]
MKFRQKLHRQIVTAWQSYYIPYQHLKASLKIATRNGHTPLADFYIRFLQAIESNVLFALQCNPTLRDGDDQLRPQPSNNALMDDFASIRFAYLQEAMMKLLSFYRVNYEAISRIQDKLTRSGHPYSPEVENIQIEIRRLGEEYLKTYNKCAEQFDKVRASSGAFKNANFDIKAHTRRLDRRFEMDEPIYDELEKLFIVYNKKEVTLLHIGATYGMINLCTHVLSRGDSVERLILSKDKMGFTPLHVSVASGHIEVTQLFLSTLGPNTALIPDDLLHIALRNQNDDMIRLLISRKVGFEFRSSSGESCLYLASQLGRGDYLNLLLAISDAQLIDSAESTCQWTPLIIACIEGHVSVVELLLNAGADITQFDFLGWTAQEHATFRGHLPVAELLQTSKAMLVAHNPLPKSDLGCWNSWKRSLLQFDCSMAHVVLNLGELQNKTLSKSSTLNLFEMSEHGLVLGISTTACSVPVERMLPLLDDPVDDTLVFQVNDPEEVSIVFDIYKKGTERGGHNTLIGTGIANLYAQKNCLGARHSTLLREQTIPILRRDTLRQLGTITFSFLVVKPYSQLQNRSHSATNIQDSNSVQLVGHRGLGQNSSKRFLQLGENTIESFLAAATQGASFVEFMHANSIQTPTGNPPSIIRDSLKPKNASNVTSSRMRSKSVTTVHENGAEEVIKRMKYTVDYSNKGFKPNMRGEFVQDTFATLRHALCKVPEEIAFDIEIKYPRIHEALEAGIAPLTIEINLFVDTILDVLTRFGRNRRIIFSSFTPEICILLAIKQTVYPIFFISNAGKRPVSDKEKRAGSLQAAVRFAKQWDLSGIVVAADSLVMCPRLIGFIKAQGLMCGSYNGLNDEPANVELQVKSGIDLIVADRVRLIAQTLKRMDVQSGRF